MKQKLFLFEDFVPEGRRIIEQLLLAHDYEIGEPADIVLVMLYPRHLHLAVEAYSHAVQDKRRRVIFLRVGMGSLNEWRTVFRAEIGGGASHRIRCRGFSIWRCIRQGILAEPLRLYRCQQVMRWGGSCGRCWGYFLLMYHERLQRLFFFFLLFKRCPTPSASSCN